MPRTTHRRRRTVSVRRARLLTVIGFRYSTSRDAYVLRIVGNRVGPVFQIAGPGAPIVTRPRDQAAA